MGLVVLGFTGIAFNYSAQNEFRTRFPEKGRFFPSRWCAWLPPFEPWPWLTLPKGGASRSENMKEISHSARSVSMKRFCMGATALAWERWLCSFNAQLGTTMADVEHENGTMFSQGNVPSRQDSIFQQLHSQFSRVAIPRLLALLPTPKRRHTNLLDCEACHYRSPECSLDDNVEWNSLSAHPCEPYRHTTEKGIAPTGRVYYLHSALIYSRRLMKCWYPAHTIV